MRVPSTLRTLPFAILAGATVAACVSTTSSEGTGSSGSDLSCPEYQVGSTIDSSTDVDVRVHAFMQASADLGGLSASLRAAVKTACIGVATDLGAQDSWSAHGDSDDAISNSGGTGACDVARAHAVAIMQGHVNANFALVVARGHCYPDFDAETKCEAGCQSQTKCTPGTVETRCTPGHLNMVCQDKCAEQSYCEGTIDVQTQCEGSCEAECAGSCSGSCTDEAGHRTDNDPSCHGKCKGHCSGTCNGRCQIDVSEGVQCGSSVTCTGTCLGSYTSPRCESEFSPPTCTIDEACFESCRTHVVATAKCDPDTVKLLADVTVSGDVAKLVASIDKNLPPLLQTAEAQGHLSIDIIQSVVSSGSALISDSGNLSIHSVACATAAAKSLATTVGDLNVSVQAGAGAAQDCSANAE
jgi:hypothetical protein